MHCDVVLPSNRSFSSASVWLARYLFLSFFFCCCGGVCLSEWWLRKAGSDNRGLRWKIVCRHLLASLTRVLDLAWTIELIQRWWSSTRSEWASKFIFPASWHRVCLYWFSPWPFLIKSCCCPRWRRSRDISENVISTSLCICGANHARCYVDKWLSATWRKAASEKCVKMSCLRDWNRMLNVWSVSCFHLTFVCFSSLCSPWLGYQ